VAVENTKRCGVVPPCSIVIKSAAGKKMRAKERGGESAFVCHYGQQPPNAGGGGAAQLWRYTSGSFNNTQDLQVQREAPEFKGWNMPRFHEPARVGGPRLARLCSRMHIISI